MKKKKKEVVQKILWEISNNNTTNHTTLDEQLPENGWWVLSQFANKRVGQEPLAFSAKELAEIFIEVMHFNTVQRMIDRLRAQALIKKLPHKYGKTGRVIKYVVTTDGIILWEKYALQQELKPKAKIKKEVMKYGSNSE